MIRILILAFVLMMTSCMTEKRLEKRSKDFYLNNQVKLAELCLDCFGSKSEPIYKQGSTIVKIDTITDSIPYPVLVDCPDGSKVKIDCPPNKTIVVERDRVDTVYEDTWQTTASVKMLEYQKDRLNKENIELHGDIYILKTEVKKQKEDLSSKTRVIWVLSLAIGAFFGYKALRLFKVF